VAAPAAGPCSLAPATGRRHRTRLARRPRRNAALPLPAPRPARPSPPRRAAAPDAPLPCPPPPQQAVAAVRALNQTPCGGPGLLEVKFADADAGERNPELSAPPSENVYAKNLPGSWGDADVRALFAPYAAAGGGAAAAPPLARAEPGGASQQCCVVS
jgi:hypothetical protein